MRPQWIQLILSDLPLKYNPNIYLFFLSTSQMTALSARRRTMPVFSSLVNCVLFLGQHVTKRPEEAQIVLFMVLKTEKPKNISDAS